MCQQRNTSNDQPTNDNAANGCATSQCDACKRRGFEKCPVQTRADQLALIRSSIPLADSILTTRELPQG
jgi:hypothetical protein